MAERRPVQVDGRATQAKLLDNDGFPAALCDPPDDCSTCFLFGNADDPAWRERVRLAFQLAPTIQGRHQPRARLPRHRPATKTDAELVALLATDCLSAAQLCSRLGCTGDTLRMRIQKARARGAPIETVWGKGYRLRPKQPTTRSGR
jgi:biotin operon repressor